MLAELVPGRLQALAVAAPAGIELKEDILRVVEDNLIELLANEDEDGLVLRLRDRLALQLGLELLLEVALDPVLDVGRRDLLALRHRVLELLLHVLNNERGPLRLVEVQRLAVVGELDGVDPDEVHLPLELLRNGADRVNLLLEVLLGAVDEEVRERLLAAGVEAVVLAVDLVDDGDGELLDPLLELAGLRALGGQRVLGALVVEGAVDNNLGRGNTGGGSNVGVGDVTEEVVVAVLLGDLGELLRDGLILLGVGDDDELVGLDELVVVGANVVNCGEGLPAMRLVHGGDT